MKRKVLSVALIVCLVAIMAFGTLAYFSDKDDITNTFMVAGYDPEDPYTNPDDIFSIDVRETDEDGNPAPDGLTYDDIQPGDELHKDPTVVNTGKYSQYVRVNVTVTNAAAWQTACAKYGITDLTTIFKNFDANAWTLAGVSEDKVNDTLTYSYYYNGVLEAGESATLFDTVVIPAAFDSADMLALQYFELIISADAIQSDNTGTVAEAFVLYDAQVNG